MFLGAPAIPANSPMSGTGKVPDRAAEPPGQPPSRPPPFQGEERRRRGPPPRSAVESVPQRDP